MLYRPHRYPSDYVLTVWTPRGVGRATIADVNRSGARISGIAGLIRDDKVRLDVLSVPVDAVVLWVRGQEAGVTFRPIIADHLVDVLRRGLATQGRGQPFGMQVRYPELR